MITRVPFSILARKPLRRQTPPTWGNVPRSAAFSAPPGVTGTTFGPLPVEGGGIRGAVGETCFPGASRGHWRPADQAFVRRRDDPGAGSFGDPD